MLIGFKINIVDIYTQRTVKTRPLYALKWIINSMKEELKLMEKLKNISM